MYEFFVANLDSSSKVEERTHNGRQYVVASATILRERVLPGNRGPLLYPAEENVANVEAWTEQPLTYGHPRKDGKYVLFNEGDKHSLGFSTDAQGLKNGKVRVRLWFDVQNIQVEQRSAPLLTRK